MRHPSSKRMFQYWTRIKGDRSAPSREEIEPGDIRYDLGDTFILDVAEKSGAISYRLAGTRLCAAYGRELKGYGFFCNFEERNCYDAITALAKVYNDFSPQLLSVIARNARGDAVDFEMLLLPLLPMPSGATRILGIATPAEMPFWLGEEPLIVNELVSVRAAQDEVETVHTGSALAPESIEGEFALSPETAKPGQVRRVKHLIVHEGGRDS